MALTQQDKEEMYQYLITRGKALGSLDEGDSNLSNKYLAPVLEYSGGTASKAVRLAVSLLQGKSAVLRKSGDLVQWQLQGASTWETLYSMADYKGLPGANGKNPVFRKNAANLEYKLDGEEDTAYKLLVALSDITGPEGDHVVLRVQDGKLEYKQSKAADSTYQLLVALSDITGPQGRPGKDFQILGYYDTIADLRTAIILPEPGEAYGVGTAAPYPIYIWDAVSQDWVNNGAIQGPAGRSGKSARVNTDTGYWEEFDDDTLDWKQTEYIVQYPIATSKKDGLLSKDDKAYLEEIRSKGIEVSKEKVEQVLTGNILSHQHGRVADLVEIPTDIWDGTSISSSLSGAGSVDDPYLINTCADWIHFVNNGLLYSPDDSGWQSEPTWEMFSHIKVTHNLDFNNQPLDFAEFWNTDLSSLPAGVLSYAVIDGGGCRFENINIYNWFSLFCCGVGIYVHHLSIGSGKFVLDVSKKNKDLLFFPLAPVVTEDYVPSISITYCSCKASFETEGVLSEDTHLSVCLSSTGILNTMGIEEVKEGYCYGNNQFVNHCDVSNHILQIGYIPIFYSKPTESGDTTILNIYDCSHANLLPSAEVTSGFYVLGIDFSSEISGSVLNLFYNSETMTLMNAGEGSSKFTPKTGEEIKSADFLTGLNGDTDTFIVDDNMTNGGYPVFKQSLIEQIVFEGYVTFSDLTNMNLGGGGIYVLPRGLISLGDSSTPDDIKNAIGGLAGFEAIASGIGGEKAYVISLKTDGALNTTIPVSVAYLADSTAKLLSINYSLDETYVTMLISYNIASQTFSFSKNSASFFKTGTGKGLSTNDFTDTYKEILEFYTGVNNITSLEKIPINKQVFYATIKSNQTISLNDGLKPGRCVQGFIFSGNASSSCVITLPNSGTYVSMSGTTATLPASGWMEINIACYATNKYIIRVGGQG